MNQDVLNATIMVTETPLTLLGSEAMVMFLCTDVVMRASRAYPSSMRDPGSFPMSPGPRVPPAYSIARPHWFGPGGLDPDR
jgi:hypothetical protein